MKQQNVSKFIEGVLLESAIDSRIDDGVVDLTNLQHIEVIHEVLQSKGLDEESIEALFEAIMTTEGKYPDRQAYNKDGWLVTFPSKEYRDAALKKGTHSISDPTHGKGGMNLYYKKRGKQKRQTQQAASATVTQQTKPAAPAAAPTTTPTAAKKPAAVPAGQPAAQQAAQPAAQEKKPENEPLPPDEGEPLSDKDIEAIGQRAAQRYQSAPQTVGAAPKEPAIDVPVVTTAPAQYAEVSKKFAIQKGWREEPYGEWKNVQGETEAVVGLSKEVVPVKSIYREEYKLFAEKNMPKQ